MLSSNDLIAAERHPLLTRLARLSLLAAAASMLGFAGQWHWLLDLCAHFRWQYMMAMLLGLAAAILARKRGAVAMLLVASMANLWSLATATGRHSTRAARNHSRRRIRQA